MKKSDYQKFLDFMKRHNLSPRRIADIVKEYASLNDEFARTYVSTRNGISPHVFYKCRDYAIIYMLVDRKTCLQVKEKSFRNQSSHNDAKNYTSSVYHYQDLIAQRRKYLESFSPETIVEIATLYAKGCPFFEIEGRYKASPYTCQKLLGFALINHLVDREIFKAIKKRSNHTIASNPNYHGPTAMRLWLLPLEGVIKSIAQLYSEGCPFMLIKNKYKISHDTCKKVLKFALINHLVDQEIFKAIEKRSNNTIASIPNYQGPTAKQLWLSFKG